MPDDCMPLRLKAAAQPRQAINFEPSNRDARLQKQKLKKFCNNLGRIFPTDNPPGDKTTQISIGFPEEAAEV